MIRFVAFALLVFVSSGQAAYAANEAWVWPAAYKAKSISATTIFLLQHHLPKAGSAERRGPWPWAWKGKTIHVVVRSERLPTTEEILPLYERTAREWRTRGATVAGLQLDYDCPTARLASYFSKVREIRRLLPTADALSITGLADWTSLATFSDLLASREITVFFQMYRERWVHEKTRLYLDRLRNVSFPFKIGLLPDQSVTPLDREALVANHMFKGFVEFHGGLR